MLLFCHLYHRYVDAARHEERHFGPGSVTEVDSELAGAFLRDHPAKFCDVSAEENPSVHVCDKKSLETSSGAVYPVTVIAAPPEDRQMKPKVRYSPQKRHLIKEARKRSRTARIQTREV